MLHVAQTASTMQRAVELARRGWGHVEPNPLVGCVVVQGGMIVGQGWHQKFGGPHAEVEALTSAAGNVAGADVYVTLEPCCHRGKTGPCTQALIDAGVGRVLVGCQDPHPQVAGGGIAVLRSAGIEVEVGILEAECQALIAPFAKRVTRGRPWVIAKWAMTLDGKLATRTGASRWISGPESRERVHALRGVVDAILVGRGTAETDDPLLTARPSGPRVPLRVVLDSQARLSPESKLAQTAREVPVLLAVAANAPSDLCRNLERLGVEILRTSGAYAERLRAVLDELGSRECTNLLVEGGATVFGTLFDQGEIDEVHAFIAPKIIGGSGPTAIDGLGVAEMGFALRLESLHVEQLGDDIYVQGRVVR